MDAKRFLESVVPWDLGGYVTIHWHRPESRGFFGRSCQSLEAALAVVDDLKARTKYNIYFCISRQGKDGGHRDRKHAIGLVCIPIDLDIKPNDPKHYATLAEAVASVLWFCDKVGFPRPSYLVASGGGLHAYWLSDRTLPVEEWQVFADALKTAARSVGLKFDPTCTGDAARVLRVPDTFNWKYGKPRQVRILEKYCTGEKYNFAEVFKNFPKVTKTGFRKKVDIEIAPAFKDLPITPLVEPEIVKDIPPLPAGPILAECGWLREAYETGGKAFDEPQWNLTTLIATFLKDGHELAHEFANQHKDYTFEETEEKLARKLQERAAKNIGWPRCRVIEAAGSTHCASCPHLPQDKSPVNFGYYAFTNPVDEDLKELGGTRPADMRLPPGFCLDERGRVCAVIRATKVKGGIKPARLMLLLLTIIKSPSLQFQNNQFGIGFIANTDRIGTAEVFLDSGSCYVKGGLLNNLAEKCVLRHAEKGVDIMLEKFASSWLDQLLKEDTAVRDNGTMGWRYEDSKRIGFVYGSTLYHEDGREIPLVASTDDDFRSWYTPIGDRQVWITACNLLTARQRPELDSIIAIGFAAPLMTFAGTLYGAILSYWGEPGTSKSTAQQVAAAVWGHPKQTRESLNSTPKSIQRRLGKCRNLAAFWDDIQDERHQDALFSTMFVATQGAEGGRLNQDATMKERLEWQTLLVACSNASFVEYLTRKQKSTTAGMRRVFEIEYNKLGNEPGMINATDAGLVFAALEQNYGTIGAEYAKMLAKEHVEISAMVTTITKEFCARVEGTGDEAYWWGSCGVLIAGAMLANRLGANLNVEAMTEHLELMFRNNRLIRSGEGTEGGTYQNTAQSLVAFLNFYVGSGNRVVVDKLFHTRGDKIHVIQEPHGGRPIVAQIVRDNRLIIFSKREMREYFHEHEIQARQVFNGLVTFFKAKEVRHTLGAGTAYSHGQEVCYEIHIPEGKPHVLLEMLESAGPTVAA